MHDAVYSFTKMKEFALNVNFFVYKHTHTVRTPPLPPYRILSISSIRKIMSHISLRDDQLDMVLGSLKVGVSLLMDVGVSLLRDVGVF